MFTINSLDFSTRGILRKFGGGKEGPPPFQSSADLRRVRQLEEVARVLRIGKGVRTAADSRNVLLELVLARLLVISQKQHVLAEMR